MFRSPWGFVYYNQSLKASDPVWLTASVLSQVPLGVNPVIDGVKYGIFIVPSNLLSTCFYEYQIGNYLDNSGYYSSYYDVENATTDLFTFTYTVP